MIDLNIILPSKPKIVSEDDHRGVYEIESLYPGYGQTLGNSLRRIILSSMVGTAITMVKIEGVPHEFSTIKGIQEDIISIILNLKKVRFGMSSDKSQKVTISVKGAKIITAADIETGGQVEVINPDQVIATMTDKNAEFKAELTLENGIGYVPKEVLQGARPPAIGTIILDAAFTPIRRVSYEVENMRVGDRTDYNRLRLAIETDGGIKPRQALEHSIEIMINQLKAIIGFKEEAPMVASESPLTITGDNKEGSLESEATDIDFLKTRVEDLDFSPRVSKALAGASIRTIGGLSRKKGSDLESIAGLGEKGIEEIREILKKHGISLRD